MKLNDENIPPPLSNDFLDEYRAPSLKTRPATKKLQRYPGKPLQELPIDKTLVRALPFALGLKKTRLEPCPSRKSTAASESTADTGSELGTPKFAEKIVPKKDRLVDVDSSKPRPSKISPGKGEFCFLKSRNKNGIESVVATAAAGTNLKSKGRKVENKSKIQYIGYLGLQNEATKKTEYFRLYKDSELGFSDKLQAAVPESVLCERR